METVAKQGGSERKNLRNSNRERVKVMRENKKTRADSTAVDNFLGKCCPRADSYPVAITIVSKTEWSRARGASEEFMGGEERKPFFL